MKISAIAHILNETHHGEDVDIERVGSIETESANDILYVESIKYLEKAKAGNPAALIIPRGLDAGPFPYIEVDDPKLAFIKLLSLFDPSDIKQRKACIDENAKISDDASIGPNATVMSGAVVMEGVQIGADCVIYPNCVLESGCSIGSGTILYPGVIVRERCIIGEDCILHPGVVIGADGYGFYAKEGNIIKIPQIGIVDIGDRVEIGANCTIDRATVDKTTIGNDTKLDNMVHIAHNVRIGKKCYIMAQAGIAGSVTVGDHVMICGQVAIADHVSIADHTVIMAQSGIADDIPKAEILFGSIARPVKEQHRIHSALAYLPELLKRVKRLEDKITGS